MHRFLLTLLLVLLVASPSIADKPSEILTPLDYRGVTLDGGTFKREFDTERAFYLRIPNDDLLKGFRARAGKPSPGVLLGGWYSDDVFHVFGQILSGLSRMYAATGDPACREKVHALVKGWSECIEPDGYFFFSRKPGAQHYIYEKMVGGLVDAKHYTGCREARTALAKITAWAEKNLNRARPYGADINEWYTLSENLYRAFQVTGDARYREFAKVWEYTDYWSVYARGGDIHAPLPNGKRVGAYHAYSHVNTLSGAGAAYEVTGERHYLDTLRNAYDYLQRAQCFAGGGYGPDESLATRDERRRRLEDGHNNFETQCGSWAGFKMSKYLLRYTGDARYGDWVEQLAINGLTGGLTNNADGRVFYYSDYSPYAGVKVYHPTPWTCCSGTRPMALADLYDQVYYRAHDGLCVNLYAPSSVTAKLAGQDVTLRQRTRFPEDETVDLELVCPKATRFTLRLRQPGWLAAPMRITVNGRDEQARVERGWAVVARQWKNGDRVQLRLPMGFRLVRLDPDKPYPVAVMRGPVLMAFCASHPVDVSRTDPDKLAQEAVASPGEPLTYHLRAEPDVLLTPFYRVKEGRPYYVYLDPAARGRVPHSSVKFTGNWNPGGFRWSNEVGATAEYTFEGTGIGWRGYRYDDAGKAEVSIDGKVVVVVDQYGPGRDLPFDWHIAGLPRGKHTVRIKILAERNPASKNGYINLAGFDIRE